MSFVGFKNILKRIISCALVLVICLPAIFTNALAVSNSYSLVCNGLEMSFSKDNGKISSLKINEIDYFSYSSSQNGFIITDVKTNTIYDVSSSISTSYNKITQSFTNSSAGISLNVVYEVKNNGIFVEGTIFDNWGTDRLIKLEYLVPVKNDGMRWFDNIDDTRTLSSGVYKYTNIPVNNQEMSVYPYSAVSDGVNTLALAVPMDPPLATILSYDCTSSRRAMVTRFNLGLSPKTTKIKSKADFSFVIYAPKESGWGMRAAVKDYYEMFPDYFEVRTREGGNWLFQHDYSILEGVEDFGFIVNETPSFALDEKNGIYSTTYTAPGELFIDYKTTITSPGYNDFVNYLESMIGSTEPDTNFAGLTKDFVARAIKNSAFKNLNGNYLINGYKAYGDSFAFVTNNSPNLPSPNVFDLEMNNVNVALKQAEDAGVTVDGIYIDNWTGGWDLDYNSAHFPYTDYPLLWDSGKNLGIPLMNTMYEYGKHIREIADQNDWVVIGNSVFAESKGAGNYVHLVDIAASEVLERDDGGCSLAEQRMKRTLVNQKPWANLLINDAGVPTSLSFKEQLLKNSMVYGVFSNVMGYRVDSSVWEECRHLFRKYLPIAKLTDKLGWYPVTHAKYQYSTSAVLERFGDFSDEAVVLTMYNTGASVLTSPVELDLAKFNIDNSNYGRLMAFDLIKNEVVPVTVSGGKLYFERSLSSNDATAVIIGSSDRIFEYIGNLAITDLKRIKNSVETLPNEYNKHLDELPAEWYSYVKSVNNLLQFADNDIEQLFENGVAIKNSLVSAYNDVLSFSNVAVTGKNHFVVNVLLPFERMIATFGGFFADTDLIPNSFNSGEKETLENSNPIWFEDFNTASAIENAVITGAKIEFPWYSSMDHHSIVVGNGAVNGAKSIRIDSPGGLINSTYLNNLSTVLSNDKDYIFTMLLKAENTLPQDFGYTVHGMTWQSSPNYFFSVELGMSNGILDVKNIVINDKNFYPKSSPKAAVKYMGDGLYSIAVRFTGAKAADGSESMFLRSDVVGSAVSISVDDFKLFSVTPSAEPADFTLLCKPILQEDFELADTVTDTAITGTAIRLSNNSSNYYSLTTDSTKVINGGKSLGYRASVATELLHFGDGIFNDEQKYSLFLSIKECYSFTDDTVISLIYHTKDKTNFEATFKYNREQGGFVSNSSSEFIAISKNIGNGNYYLYVDFTGDAEAYFTLKFNGKIICSIDDITIRGRADSESKERYITRRWLTAYNTSEKYASTLYSFNPVYQEDFIPLWNCDFEEASGVYMASVLGTDVTFAWLGSEEQHYIANSKNVDTADGVINGNRSLVVNHGGSSLLNSISLFGNAKPKDGSHYVSTFNIKFISDIPDNFRFTFYAMTWDGSPNYFFTLDLHMYKGELVAGITNTDSAIYPNQYIQPECVIKRLSDNVYSVALHYQGAKSSSGSESMFLRTSVEGDAVAFALDDMNLFVARSDVKLDNMTSKGLLVFNNGFESATAVGSNNITGATMFKALRHPLNGTKMSANYSINNSTDAIDGEKSLVFENTNNTKIENLSFGANAETVYFKQSNYYVTTFKFKSVSANEQSSIIVHYRSGGYSPVADDYLYSVKLCYSENDGSWFVSEITKNSNVYFNSLPTATLKKIGDIYHLAISFAGSKDRSGLEGTFFSLEMNGNIKLLLDDFAIYQSYEPEDTERYVQSAITTVLKLGDIDFSGYVDAVDLTLLRKQLIGYNVLTNESAIRVGDMNENGSLDIVDLVKLKKAIVKL